MVNHKNNNLKEYRKWLEKRNLSSETVRIYCWAIREYGDNELTTENIVEFLKANLTKYQPASLESFRYALSSLAKFQKITIEWEMITRLIPTVQRKFFTTINQEELELLKNTRFENTQRTNSRNSLLLDFLLYTGLRVKELINIRHCDYQNESLWIRGKGNKIRYIPIPDFLAKHFNNSLDYLFKTWKGEKISDDWVRKIIYKKTKKAGMSKRITPHTFRRSFATLLNNNKCKLTTIQKLLGHSKINTTTQYIHNSFEEIRQDYNKIFTPPPPSTINSFKK